MDRSRGLLPVQARVLLLVLINLLRLGYRILKRLRGKCGTKRVLLPSILCGLLLLCVREKDTRYLSVCAGRAAGAGCISMTLDLSRHAHEHHIHEALKDAAHAGDMVYNLWTHDLRRGAVKDLKAVLPVEAGLNAVMEHMKSNTHVATLQSWRDRGFEADFIQDLTRGAGEKKASTAAELLKYLVEVRVAGHSIFSTLFCSLFFLLSFHDFLLSMIYCC